MEIIDKETPVSSPKSVKPNISRSNKAHSEKFDFPQKYRKSKTLEFFLQV